MAYQNAKPEAHHTKKGLGWKTVPGVKKAAKKLRRLEDQASVEVEVRAQIAEAIRNLSPYDYGDSWSAVCILADLIEGGLGKPRP